MRNVRLTDLALARRPVGTVSGPAVFAGFASLTTVATARHRRIWRGSRAGRFYLGLGPANCWAHGLADPLELLGCPGPRLDELGVRAQHFDAGARSQRRRCLRWPGAGRDTGFSARGRWLLPGRLFLMGASSSPLGLASLARCRQRR